MSQSAIKFLTFFLLLAAHTSTLLSQTDTEFWFVAPEVWAGHGDNPIVLRFATFDEAANITIEQPANPSFPAQTLSIAANGTSTVNLTAWMGMIENKPVNTTLSYGLHIISDAPITAYYEVNHNDNPDIFTLKGSSALGTEFYTPFQNYLSNNYTESKAGIDVVATEDNTEITVVPSVALTGHPADVAFTIMLNAGETYSMRAASTAAAAHPGGTYISSSAPIAVTMSDDSIVGSPFGGTCFDLLGDQLIPVSVAGDEYIAVKGVQLGGADRVFILATENNTEVFINGTLTWTLNAGETYTHVLGAPVAYYETSAPVIVLHMTGVGCEVGGAILPPLRCTGSRDIAFVRSTNASFSINLLVQAGSEGDFTFNGNPAFIGAGDFTDVPGAAGLWKYAQITTTAFVPTLSASRIENSTGYFHMGVINGTPAGYCRYGYFSGFAQYEFQTYTDDDSLCSGEMVTLYADPIENATYTWTGPSGFNIDENVLTIGPVDETYAGMYIVTGNVGECEITPDTLILTVQPAFTAPDLIWDAPTCQGDDLILTCPTVGNTWQWTGPNGELVESDSILVISDAQPSDGGMFTVQAEVEGCLSLAAEISVEITPTVAVSLIENTSEACLGSVWSASPEGTIAGPDWTWEFPNGEVLNNASLNLTDVGELDAGWYVLNASEQGCSWSADSIELVVALPQDLAFDFPSPICSDDAPFALVVNASSEGLWSASCGNCIDEDSGVFNPNLAGDETLEITFESQGVCQETLSSNMELINTPSATFDSPFTACLGQGDVLITAENTGGVWTSDCDNCLDSNGQFNTSLAGEGTWNIQHALNGECPSNSSGEFIVTANLSSSFDLPAAFCINEPSLELVGDLFGGSWSSDCGGCLNSNGVLNPAIAGLGTPELTYTIEGNCGSSTSQNTIIHPLPTTDFTSTPSSGCTPMLIEFEGTANPGGSYSAFGIIDSNGFTAWSNQGANTTMTVEIPGCYDLVYTATDANGCTNSTQQNSALCVYAPPNANFNYTPALPESYGTLMEFTATNINAPVDFEWFLGTESVSTNSQWNINTSDINDNPAYVCLEVQDSLGCVDLACQSIITTSSLTVYAPTAFTPDHDGHNDVWKLIMSADVTSVDLKIYDRWNNLVFQTQNLDHWWQGDVQDGDYFAPDGVYTWTAVLRGDQYQVRSKKGHIVLIR
ncbi:MAG: gliding motility-associated C-terminal domain-containing protein [Flavobacteriales bacterium]|nr:gliding motility-associated C-terminal domain-containing protein [Flavobacteriales bacterium]